MTLRTIVVGTLGLFLVLVWAMALVYQRHHVDYVVAAATASRFVDLRVASFWSLLQLGVSALLVVPLILASVGAMLGLRLTFSVLRTVARLSAVLSLGTFVTYGIMVAPIVARGGPLLPFGGRYNYELLAAGCALVLQSALLVLLRSTRDPGQGFKSAASLEGHPPREAPQPPGRDLRLTTNHRPLVARG